MTVDETRAGDRVSRDDERLRKELRATNERLARQREELRHLKNAQGALRLENRELNRHALALEGELADALLALDAGDYDEARALLVRARGELARAVSDRAVESAEPAEQA
jgi:predicted  nucleic acid-binding Zn-ribbon protein